MTRAVSLFLFCALALNQAVHSAKEPKKKSSKGESQNKPSVFNLLKDAEISGDLRLGGDYVNSTQQKARVFGVTSFLNVLSPITDSIELDLSIGAVMEVGSNNSFVIDEYAPARQVLLKRTFLAWSPLKETVSFKLKAGAINQREYNAPLLITGTAFLGAQQELFLNLTENHRFFIKAEQAIPNNLNLVQRIGVVDQDGTPKFLMETIGMELDGDILAINVQGGRWSYDSLSAGIANQSRFLGNTVTPGNNINSRFLYGYSGYTASGSMRFNMSSGYGAKFEGQYLYNDKAPEGRNKGFFFKSSAILGRLRPSFTFFSTESDTSPAFYNSSFYVHNNHEGTAIELAYSDPYDDNGNKIEAKIAYTDSSPILFNSFQSNAQKVHFLINLPFNY